MTIELPQKPWRTEFLVVVLATYGLHFSSTLSTWVRGVPTEIVISYTHVLNLVVAEIGLAALLGVYLFRRGWRWQHFKFRFGVWQTVVGVGLVALDTALYWFVAVIAIQFPSFQDAAQRIFVSSELTWPLVLMASLINPVFEEFLNLGYVQQRLAARGPALAIGVAVLLRLITHAYQGAWALVSIVPVGLVFSGFFWRYRRLYPIVVAHAIMDFIALSMQTR